MEHSTSKRSETHSQKSNFMKNICIWCVCSLLVARCANPHTANAQGSFQNLNFESAAPGPPITGPIGGADYQPIGLALPGWNASIGGISVTEVLQNNYTLGAASIDILGPGWGSLYPFQSIDPGIIDGNYTVFLQAFNTGQGNVSLWQNGTIPANAESLQFSAWSYLSSTATFSVSFGGNSLSPVVLSSGQSPSGQPYDVYAVNIAPYAGLSGQLEFTANPNNYGPSWTAFDDITFSTNVLAVPEPNTLALILTGGLALAARRWRAKRS